MKKSIEELYQEAKRFDESEIYQSKEYDIIVENKSELYEKMRLQFGVSIIPLLEEYTAIIGEEAELECRHFFEQGYFMGQK